MTRQIASLQTVVLTVNDSDAPGGSYWSLRHIALCDDGTAWITGGGWKEEWERLPAIPQRTVDAE